jgi:molecular chaperone GrpE (heat shock protein)
MQKEMDGRRVEIEKLKEEIEKKGPLMTAEVRREKQDLFERKRRDAARLADDLQKELEKKESGLLQKVLSDLAGVIDRINLLTSAVRRGSGKVVRIRHWTHPHLAPDTGSPFRGKRQVFRLSSRPSPQFWPAGC